jgi:hypothetical protein
MPVYRKLTYQLRKIIAIKNEIGGAQRGIRALRAAGLLVTLRRGICGSVKRRSAFSAAL